jgi:predicted kinase
MMKTVILTKGLPGSGKTSWAKNKILKNPNSYKRVNKDDLRAMMDASKWSKDAEKFVLKVRDFIIQAALEEGKHVIVDDTNLHPKHKQHIRELVKDKAFVVDMDLTEVPLDVCIKRDLERPKSVGEKVIKDMHKRFLTPNNEIFQDEKLPSAIICDLDGTLALIGHRDPYDASSCEKDELNKVVFQLIRDYDGWIFFLSGRSDKYEQETKRWLDKHVPSEILSCRGATLVMRKEGDLRKDSIVKREMFEKRIADKFFIEYVLDDRNQVVELWRSMGLTCLQVADGDF